MNKAVYCIDIGNTRTHCAVVEVSASGEICRVVESADYRTSGFAESFADGNLFAKSGAEAVAWCSVVPRAAAALEKVLPRGAFRLTHENSPITLDVARPEQVGHDRIADAIGAGSFFAPPYVVVDMGTAVTIDFVDGKGRYAGGAIAPGLHAFTSYLSERAAQLPKIDIRDGDFDAVLGRDTKSAMFVGCAKGFCRLADGLLADIAGEYFSDTDDISAKTVFTGGSVPLLPKKWLAGRRVECNLAQIGLALAFTKNRKHR